jgi:hypothetical protein
MPTTETINSLNAALEALQVQAHVEEPAEEEEMDTAAAPVVWSAAQVAIDNECTRARIRTLFLRPSDSGFDEMKSTPAAPAPSSDPLHVLKQYNSAPLDTQNSESAASPSKPDDMTLSSSSLVQTPQSAFNSMRSPALFNTPSSVGVQMTDEC